MIQPFGNTSWEYNTTFAVIVNGSQVENGLEQLTWVEPPTDTATVEFFDGVTSLGVFSSPFQMTTAALALGAHVFHATASPSGIKTGTATVMVTPTAPVLVAPTNQTTVPGTVINIDATTVNDSVTTGVDAIVTGPDGYSDTIGLVLGGGHWTGTWNTTSLNDGAYTVFARRYTATGNADSAPATVTLQSKTIVVDTFITDGTWTAPPNIWSLTSVSNHVEVYGWGAGGDGIINTGAGGGPAYSTKDYVVVPGNNYTVSVPASSGGDMSFDSGGVLAKGGSNGNTGIGGQASACVGDIKYSGGNGSVGVAAQRGGGGAGSQNNGSGFSPGEPDGAVASSTGVSFVASGGRSTAATAATGGRSECRIEYLTDPTTGFGRLIGIADGRDTGSSTTRNITLPTSPSPSGGGILVIVSAAANVTITMDPTWTAFTQASEGSISMRAFYAADNDSLPLVITTSLPARCSWRVMRLCNASNIAPVTPTVTVATGNSTNPAPPDSGTIPSGNYLAVAAAAISSVNPCGLNSQPTGYGNYVSLYPSTQTSQFLCSADKLVTGTSEAPGPFTTSISAPWCAMTIMVPQ